MVGRSQLSGKLFLFRRLVNDTSGSNLTIKLRLQFIAFFRQLCDLVLQLVLGRLQPILFQVQDNNGRYPLPETDAEKYESQDIADNIFQEISRMQPTDDQVPAQTREIVDNFENATEEEEAEADDKKYPCLAHARKGPASQQAEV